MYTPSAALWTVPEEKTAMKEMLSEDILEILSYNCNIDPREFDKLTKKKKKKEKKITN